MDLNLKTVNLEMFARFGVTQAWLAQAGVWRATDVEARREFLITRPGDMSGLVFPYVDPVSGCRATARIRRDHPEIDTDGKPAKYNRHLYFPPGSGPLLGDGGVPVVLVESEKAALALTALATRVGRQLLSIAAGGCWGWHGKTGIQTDASGEHKEARGPLPDLECVNWLRRKTGYGKGRVDCRPFGSESW